MRSARADARADQTGAAGRSRRTQPAWRTSLVADSDVAIGRLLGRDLLQEGFGVELEYTGQAVLDHVRGGRPDTVIVGGDLPDMTALDLMGRLCANPGPPLMVLLDAQDADVVQVLDAGADDCMRKARLWGSPDLSPAGRIASVVRNLRRKLELTADGPVRLLAVPQVGYRLVVSTEGNGRHEQP